MGRRWSVVIGQQSRAVKLKFHGTVLARMSATITVVRVGRVGRFPRPACLPRVYLVWSAGGLLRCSAARLSACRCRSPKSTSTTRTTCCGHPREDVMTILGRKLLPWNLSLWTHATDADRLRQLYGPWPLCVCASVYLCVYLSLSVCVRVCGWMV